MMLKFENKLATLWGFRFLLNSRNVVVMILKVLLTLLIAYSYLFLCGLVLDMWLKWYFLSNFIFVSWVVLEIFAIFLSVLEVCRFVRMKKAN